MKTNEQAGSIICIDGTDFAVANALVGRTAHAYTTQKVTFKTTDQWDLRITACAKKIKISPVPSAEFLVACDANAKKPAARKNKGEIQIGVPTKLARDFGDNTAVYVRSMCRLMPELLGPKVHELHGSTLLEMANAIKPFVLDLVRISDIRLGINHSSTKASASAGSSSGSVEFQAGARTDFNNAGGDAALDMAMQSGHEDIAKLTREKGAEPSGAGPSGASAEVKHEDEGTPPSSAAQRSVAQRSIAQSSVAQSSVAQSSADAACDADGIPADISAKARADLEKGWEQARRLDGKRPGVLSAWRQQAQQMINDDRLAHSAARGKRVLQGSELSAQSSDVRPSRHHRPVRVKIENSDEGLIRCPECKGGLLVSETGCNLTTCRNSPEHRSRKWLHFCFHCRSLLGDGLHCMVCPERVDRSTRAAVKKARNEKAARNPIELLSDSDDAE